MSATRIEDPHPTSAVVDQRLLGLDLFRALAVFGMLVAHVGPAALVDGRPVWVWEVFHSRMPAMFAFAAGMSMALMTGGAQVRRGARLRRVRVVVAVRALALSALGALLSSVGSPVVVILVYFGVYFLLALPVLGWGARALAGLAVAVALGGPVLSYALRSGGVLSRSTAVELLVTGDYPATTWMAFIFSGMAVGRLDLGSGRVRRRLVVGGSALAALAYGTSALFLHAGGRERLIASLSPTPGATASYHRLTYAETGVTPTSDWGWLATAGPHSGALGDVLGSLGVCLLALGLLLPLGDRLAQARRDQQPRPGARGALTSAGLAVGWAAACTGSMVLSVYAGHIVVMGLVHRLLGHSFVPAQPLGVLVAFTVGLAMVATAWGRWRGRGPLESVLHRLGVLAGRGVRAPRDQ